KINQVRIVPKKDKTYVIEIVYEVEAEKIEATDNYAGIDIGLNNLATIVTNTGSKPVIINGRPLKAINQYYNKRKAELQSKLPFYVNGKGEKKQHKSSKAIRRLTEKRNRKIKDYMHKASRKVVNYMQENNISTVVVGQNNGWKQEINIGRKNNQSFTAIPHATFVNMCHYKHSLSGIEQRVREESYTSKCSFLDDEPVMKHEKYLGRRIKRGLFKTKDGFIWNSDCNGSANILKKEVPNAFANGIEGVLAHPQVISC
ncbi:MAG: RNA-guided endonuclease InsQ/TnpB family protein, partial [Waterburya sp.]